MTTDTIESTDVVVVDTPRAMIERESELRDSLIPVVRAALEQKGAIERIIGRDHYTRSGLLTIAGHLNVSCEFHSGATALDPVTDAQGFEITCTATRMDGVKQEAVGFASLGETIVISATGEIVQRWADWFAIRSMAQTRAQVRALNALLLPAIQQALGDKVSSTPAEDMPHERVQRAAAAALPAPAAKPAALSESKLLLIKELLALGKALGNDGAQVAGKSKAHFGGRGRGI